MIEKQGLIIVNTGDGKGKTTAALGIGMRAWGQGLNVLVLQFIKGNWKYGELNTAAKLNEIGPRFEMRQLGEGFTFSSKGEAKVEHEKAAEAALEIAKKEITSPEWDIIILDEINYAVKFGLISEEAVLELLKLKPLNLHLILTGRNAHPLIIEQADTVTEMCELKHAYKKGIKAQKGIEF